jgi:hypothetical protein
MKIYRFLWLLLLAVSSFAHDLLSSLYFFAVEFVPRPKPTLAVFCIWLTCLSAGFAQTHTEVTIEDPQTITASKTFSGAATNVKTLEGVYQADQWCTVAGTLNQSCIQNIVNFACSGLTAGQNAYVPIFAPAGVYTFGSAVTLPGTGFCRLDINGEHAAGVGGTEFLASGNTVTLFDLTNGQTDTGAFHHIWFQSQGTIATATNDALKLGKVGGQTLYDFYVEDSWFNGFNKAIDCINCSGVTLVRNSIELNNYGFWCAPASTDRCNSHVFVANRWFENGLGIADGGALRCDNTSGSANVGNITVSAGVMDFNGNFTAGVSGFAVKLVNGCNTVSMAGVDFHDQTYDDINVSNSTDVTITGNTTATTNHLFIDCFDCRGVTATGNTIGKTDVGNAVPHAVISLAVSAATSANNVISSNTSSFTGGTTATAYLKTDAGTTGTTAVGNLYPALTQQQLYSSVLDTTAVTRIAQQAYVSSASNPQLCAGDANVIGTSDNQACIRYNSAGNYGEIFGLHNGVGGLTLKFNRTSFAASEFGGMVQSIANVCTNGELALSAGWQSTGTATVTAVQGTGQTCSWTITTGTTTAANPTITDTLTNSMTNGSVVCWMTINGGTHTAVAGESLRQTTISATAPVFTANFTPTAGGTTYFVTRGCGP